MKTKRGLQPVVCNGGIAHPRFFGCPCCCKEVGGYVITGDGPDDWSTHQDNFCSVCGQKIDWDGVNFSEITKV